MKTTLEFIADLKKKTGIESDYAAAKLLNVTGTALSSYRNGKSHFSDDVAMRVADLLELDPAYVVACIHAERAKRAEEKKLWERIAESMIAVAAVLAVLAVLPFGADLTPALHFSPEGAPLLALGGFTSALHNIHYAYFAPGIFAPENWPLFLALFLVLLAARPRHTPPKK